MLTVHERGSKRSTKAGLTLIAQAVEKPLGRVLLTVDSQGRRSRETRIRPSEAVYADNVELTTQTSPGLRLRIVAVELAEGYAEGAGGLMAGSRLGGVLPEA